MELVLNPKFLSKKKKQKTNFSNHAILVSGANACRSKRETVDILKSGDYPDFSNSSNLFKEKL